ncbi:MAG: hypothetical protein IPF85_16175 [Anaerolineae bacterium]|nr:hypothetical protein [Anaerolineae bacterium]
MSQAAARARAGEGPTFIEGLTYRLSGHMAGDLETYRTPEEIEYQRQHEPLVVLTQKLVAPGSARLRCSRCATRWRQRSRRPWNLPRKARGPIYPSPHQRLCP